MHASAGLCAARTEVRSSHWQGESHPVGDFRSVIAVAGLVALLVPPPLLLLLFLLLLLLPLLALLLPPALLLLLPLALLPLLPLQGGRGGGGAW